jgi:hypothetical protein
MLLVVSGVSDRWSCDFSTWQNDSAITRSRILQNQIPHQINIYPSTTRGIYVFACIFGIDDLEQVKELYKENLP